MEQRWLLKTHFLRPDEYICPLCGTKSACEKKACPKCCAPLKRAKADVGWVDEAEGLAAMLEDD